MQFYIRDKNILRRAIEYISNLQFEKYEIVIREKKRSLNQNAYYWTIVGIIAKELGYTKDDMHDSFRQHFLGTDFKKSYFGDIYPELKSTTKLTKEEFMHYFNKVQAFAIQQGIILPTKRDLGY